MLNTKSMYNDARRRNSSVMIVDTTRLFMVKGLLLYDSTIVSRLLLTDYRNDGKDVGDVKLTSTADHPCVNYHDDGDSSTSSLDYPIVILLTLCDDKRSHCRNHRDGCCSRT